MQTLQKEGNSEEEHIDPPDQWPTDGELEFHKVELKYRKELPPALDNISFVIKSGEHIGNNNLIINLRLLFIRLSFFCDNES